MKLLLLLAPFLASLVAGQASVGSLPQCAIGCVQQGIASTGCNAVDVLPTPLFPIIILTLEGPLFLHSECLP
jgi:hypothetical protein